MISGWTSGIMSASMISAARFMGLMATVCVPTSCSVVAGGHHLGNTALAYADRSPCLREKRIIQTNLLLDLAPFEYYFGYTSLFDEQQFNVVAHPPFSMTLQLQLHKLSLIIYHLMISQIFFLSARGDSIINRDFRSDLIKNTPQLFYRKVKLSKGDVQPIFNIEGINFAYLKKSSIYVVATTRFNISPSYILELLNRIVVIIKDFCGVINEEVIRKNFVLIYEILDEIIDFGHPQLTNTSHIKPLIASEVVEAKSNSILDIKKLGSFSLFGANTINSSASSVSVNSKTNQNEIFIDIYEKINILFNSSGYVINSSVDGCIQMKSYLIGNPALKLILNDDITLAETNTPGSIVLDDCNFHETVQHNEFLTNKALKITPPEGEFIVMNYRITTDFNAPFKVFAFFENETPYKLVLTVKLKSTYSKEIVASFINVRFNVPKKVSNINSEVVKNQGNQRVDYNQSTNSVEWVIKKMPGDNEYTIMTKITLPQATASQAIKETGPINLSFEIPNHSVSGLQIKSLKNIQGTQPPSKWVRYITKSSSYVCRI